MHSCKLEPPPLVAPLQLRKRPLKGLRLSKCCLAPAITLLQLLCPAAEARGAVHADAILKQRRAYALHGPIAAVNGGRKLRRSRFALLLLPTWPRSQSKAKYQSCRADQHKQVSSREAVQTAVRPAVCVPCRHLQAVAVLTFTSEAACRSSRAPGVNRGGSSLAGLRQQMYQAVSADE